MEAIWNQLPIDNQNNEELQEKRACLRHYNVNECRNTAISEHEFQENDDIYLRSPQQEGGDMIEIGKAYLFEFSNIDLNNNKLLLKFILFVLYSLIITLIYLISEM